MAIQETQDSDRQEEEAEEFYLARLEDLLEGETPDVEALCAERPELAAALRNVHELWQWLEGARGGGRTPPRPAFALQTEGEEGRYRLVEEIAGGGMGTVFRVRDTRLRRTLAMKVAEGRGDGSTGERQGPGSKGLYRFLQEAQVMGQLDHPGVPPVHDIGMNSEGRAFFTMRLVRGHEFRKVIKWVREGSERWNLTKAVHVLIRVCETLAFAHSKGVIHRDLKPANVMVGRFGETYVCDWGLARVMGRAEQDGECEQEDPLESDREREAARDPELDMLTRRGAIIGTPAYMPPEQAAGETESLGPHTDVYAVGAMLYHLLAGRAPHAGSTGGSTIPIPAEALAKRRPEPLWKLAPEAPVELIAICEKAMEFEITDRYPGMELLLADLSAYVEGRVVAAHATGTLAVLRKWVIRNKALAGAIGATILTVMLGLGGISWVQAEGKRQVMRLSDSHTLAELLRRSDQLWPAWPDMRERYRDWLMEAELLALRTEDHRLTLAAIERRGQALPAVWGEVSWDFDDDRDHWWHANLSRLVTDLEQFKDPDHGRIADVRERLDYAETVDEASRSGEAARLAWDEALVDISDPDRVPSYGGLRLSPQLDLIPLGPDPVSGLWEFAHLATGDPPVRDPETHKLLLTDESALVFVLLPGGAFVMGAQANDPDSPNYDPGATSREGPPHKVSLGPFFLSKYEMTLGQWRRVHMCSPSYFEPGTEWGGRTYGLLNPVEQVSWDDCTQTLARLGLLIPTEAQWEYGGRGGTDTPYWTGADPRSVAGAGNIADRWCHEHDGPPGWAFDDWLDDGYTYHAPVGTYSANAFGLHETMGNLWEWVRDAYGDYDLPVREGDGLRLVPEAGEVTLRAHRGGSFSRPTVQSRSACRDECLPTLEYYNLGVRPSREIEL